MTDNNNDNVLDTALDGLPDSPLYIADELRCMANAEPPYTGFADFPPMTLNILQAAADILERTFKTEGQSIQ